MHQLLRFQLAILIAICLKYINGHALNKKDDESKSIFHSKKWGTVTKEQLDTFKVIHQIPNDQELILEEISDENTFSYNGKVYSLEGTPTEIFTADATYVHNGVTGDIPTANVFQIADDKDELAIVMKTSDQEVRRVMIMEKKTGDSVILESIINGVLVSQKSGDSGFVGASHRSLHFDMDIRLKGDQIPIRRNRICDYYRIIELAVAYESSFCAEVGNEESANERVQDLVSMVSLKYQQENLCVKVKLSYLEGWCNPDDDPYKKYADMNLSGCRDNGAAYGLINFVLDYWNSNRVSVHRDVMQLFTGSPLDFYPESGAFVLGCAYRRGTTCNKEEAYAVSHATSKAIAKMATLVAHELGHNNGAGHAIDEDYIMSQGNLLDLKGFSVSSITAFNSYFSLTPCVEDELIPPTVAPTPAPVPNLCVSCKRNITQALQFMLRSH